MKKDDEFYRIQLAASILTAPLPIDEQAEFTI